MYVLQDTKACYLLQDIITTSTLFFRSVLKHSSVPFNTLWQHYAHFYRVYGVKAYKQT